MVSFLFQNPILYDHFDWTVTVIPPYWLRRIVKCIRSRIRLYYFPGNCRRAAQFQGTIPYSATKYFTENKRSGNVWTPKTNLIARVLSLMVFSVLTIVRRFRMTTEIMDNFEFNDQNETQLSDIQSFYKDTTIFLTGGTGFMGNLILEKLLR